MTDLEEPQALRLAKFLHEFTKRRMSVLRDVGKYDHCMWFEEVPLAEGCVNIARSSGTVEGEEVESGIWLRVEEPQVTEPPKPVQALGPWLDEAELASAEETPPTLLGETSLPDPNWASDSETCLLYTSPSPRDS